MNFSLYRNGARSEKSPTGITGGTLCLFQLAFLNLHNCLFCLHHTGRRNQPHVAHGVFRCFAVNTVHIVNVDSFEGKRHALKGSGTGGHPFHDATLVAAVADHAGDGGCHVVQHILHSLQISALEPADGYCHAGAGSMSFLIS